MTVHNSKIRGILGLLAISALAGQSLASEQGDFAGRYWALYGAVHYAQFDGLGDVQPSSGGSFDTSGPGLELGGYTNATRWGAATVLAGVEIGFLGFNTDVFLEADPRQAEAESAFEVDYFTGSLKFRFGESGERYFDADVGLGYYWGHTLYIDCAVITSCFEAESTAESVGGYVGITASPGAGFIFGARVHAVYFDPIEAIGPQTGGIRGPIVTVFAGWEFGRWRY